MADLLRRFGTNVEAEREGAWNDLGGGIRVKIARWSNQRFIRRFEELIAPHRADIDAGTLDPTVDQQVMARVMADTIVMDWEGIELDGKTVPYSPDQAYELLIREDLKDFRADIQRRAQRVERYRTSTLKADAKNSASA